jgi:hypothetical protein
MRLTNSNSQSGSDSSGPSASSQSDHSRRVLLTPDEVTEVLQLLTQRSTIVSIQTVAAETSLTVPAARKTVLLLCDHNHLKPTPNGYQFVSSYSMRAVATRLADTTE